MEKFLESAKIAWNPVGAARKRVFEGTFTVGGMLAPYIGIVITCNLFSVAAQQFFNESLLFALGRELPEHPLLNNNYAFQFLAAIQVLAPLGAIAILPSTIFSPSKRNAVLAAILAIAAAFAFYGAALSAPVYFFSGMIVTVDPGFGMSVLTAGMVPLLIVQILLIPFFWFRITMSILGISGARSLMIIVIGAIPLAALAWFVLYIADGSF